MTDAPRGDAVSDNACKTPLIDLLKSVPADARATYEHHPTAHSNIPYGRLCNEAAAEIERLRAELAKAKRDAEKYQWLRRRTTLGVGMVNIWSAGKGRYDCWQEEELDAAIDDAMKEPGHE